MNAARAVLVCALAAVAAPAQTVIDVNRGTVHGAGNSAKARLDALCGLLDAGALDAETAAVAMGATDERLAAAAVAIVRHQLFPLPPELFAALDRAPRAAGRFLAELAIAPRPAAAAWVTQWMGAPERTPEERCLALAARGTAFTSDDAKGFLDAMLAGAASDGWHAALAVLPANLADGLLGKLHQALLAEKLTLEQLLAVCDRMSPAGVQRLLGLAVMLPPPSAHAVLRHVHSTQPAVLRERIAAVLDGTGAVEELWLPFAGPLLDRGARRERVRALLAPSLPATTRQLAFEALVDAQVVDAAELEFAIGEEDQAIRLQRVAYLLDKALDALPDAVLLQWLVTDVGLADAVLAELPRRRALGAELSRHLFTQLQQAGTIDGRFFRPAAQAVVAHGDEAAVRALWPLVRLSAAFDEFVITVVVRKAPFGRQLLAEDLRAEPVGVTAAVRAAHRREAALGLAMLGDRSALPDIVRDADACTADFLRRCAALGTPLEPDLAHRLLDLLRVPRLAVSPDDAARWREVTPRAKRPIDDVVAFELFAWAATAVGDASISERLRHFAAAPAATDVLRDLQAEVLAPLARGALRPQLVAELRASLAAGPLDARSEALATAVLDSMASPLDADSLRLCADLVLVPPRVDRDGEAERVARGADGRSGFRLVAAVAHRLRGADPAAVETAFAAAAAEACAAAGGPGATATRARALFVALVRDPDVRFAVGYGLLPWLQAIDVGQHEVWPVLVAAWWSTVRAFERGDLAAAAGAPGLAVRLLHEPIGDPDLRRDLLGERDPGAGSDPFAALACLPHRIAHAVAVAAGDSQAAAEALARVREFAGRDAATLATLPSSVLETPR